jgi:hypothetical protein
MSASTQAVVDDPSKRRTAHALIPLALAATCAVILAIQALLIWRINVNWDEFYFLAYVHSLIRGEMTGTFQVAYTHLFTWLPAFGDEMGQIIAARHVMYVLFAISAVLVARLASRWASTPASMVAMLCFLSAEPVLRHGASFRADSLLLPVVLVMALLLTRHRSSTRTDALVGLCFGVALVISVKAVLFAPMLAVLATESSASGPAPMLQRLRSLAVRWALPAGIAFGVFALILVLHTLSLPAQGSDDPATYGSRVARKVLLDVPFFSRMDYFRETLNADLATWLLIGIGTLAAIARRRWIVAACVLALLPIAIYRNAFPYFYVVMLAPASVLAAVAVDEIRALVQRRQASARLEWLPLALAVPLLLQASVHLYWLKADRQWPQRQTVAAVHQIFPRPVAYFDHSGMIASFRKANFFMSSWGMDNYRARGTGFVREALRTHRPHFLLANRHEIDPLSPSFRRLRAEDRELIGRFYFQYWGPIWIAGAQLDVPAEGSAAMAVPFPGRYRVVARRPVVIDGVLRRHGEIIEVTGEECLLARPDSEPRDAPFRVVLVTAEAQSPPAEPAGFGNLYVGL